jgi:heme-degrading monooxygenase HmoA
MIQQLRIYEIFEHNKDAFHARFRDHAARLMRAHGFRIVDMWESRTDRRLEFVYLLEWEDEAARDTAWRALMSDAEWNAIKRQTGARHGDLVGAIEDRTLRRTDYSPASGLSTERIRP